MSSITLLWVCVFCSVGFLSDVQAECNKPKQHPYELHFTPEATKAEAGEKKIYKYSEDFTMCVHQEFNNDDTLTISVPVGKYQLDWAMDPGGSVGLSGGGMTAKDKDVLSDGKWYYICMTNKKKHGSLFIDGKKVDAENDMQSLLILQKSVDGLVIELQEEPDDATSHFVGEVRYYDRVLTDEEIKAVSCGNADAPEDQINWKGLSWCDIEPEKSTAPKIEGCE